MNFFILILHQLFLKKKFLIYILTDSLLMQVPFYLGLKALRDHVRGDRVLSDMKEIIFPDVDLKV